MNISFPPASRLACSTRRLAASLVAFCLATGLANADATIQLPASVSGNVGAFVQVPATTSGATVKWLSIDPGLNLFPTSLLKDTKTAVVTSPTAGSFRLIAWTSDQTGPSDAAASVITIGTPTPPPPPADPLTQALQAGYAADLVTTRAAKKPLLQGLYYGAAQNLMRADYFNNAGEVYQNIETGRKRLISDADLANVRGTIQGYLNGKFPPTQALDSTTRAGLATEFTHIATALGSIN